MTAMSEVTKCRKPVQSLENGSHPVLSSSPLVKCYLYNSNNCIPFDLKIHRHIRLGETSKSITPAGPQTHTDVEVAYMQLHAWQTKADFEHWNPRTSWHQF